MKILKSCLLISVVAGSFSLSACDKKKPFVVDSIKDGFIALDTIDNYTLEISETVDGEKTKLPSFKANESFVGFEDDNDRSSINFLLKGSDGVYRLRYTEDFLPSEYLKDDNGKKYTSIYDNKNINTMYDMCTDFVNGLEDNVESIVVKDKSYKIALITTLGYKSNEIINFVGLTAKYDGTDFSFVLDYKNSSTSVTKEIDVKLTNVDSTTSEAYNKFMKKSGKPFTPSEDIDKMRDILKSNNYMQNLFYFDNEQANNGYFYLRYCFAPHYYYYYSFADTSSINGYIDCDHTADPNDPEDVTIKGVYPFSVSGGKLTVNPSFPYYSEPNVVEYNHYPSLLKLLDNLELIEDGRIGKEYSQFGNGSNYYHFDDEELVQDFKENFSLSQSDFNPFPCAGVSIEVNLDYANPNNNYEAEPVFCFHYMFVYGSTVYDYPFPFFGYQRATTASFDALLSIVYDNIPVSNTDVEIEESDEEKGCKGSVGVSSALLASFTAIGIVLVLKRRREEI